MKFPIVSILLIALLGVLASSGCIPPTYYKDMTVTVNYSGNAAITAATQDLRKYVVSGQTEPSYEGQVRSTVGIPYHRSTSSGFPLAGEMNKALITSLQQRGFRVTPVSLAPQATFETAKQSLLTSGPERAILLSIDEWMYDGHGFAGYTIQCDLTIKVIDKEGQLLASVQAKGEQNLGTNPYKPVKIYFQGKLNQLLNDPKVAAALQVAAAAPAPPAASQPAAAPPAEPAKGAATPPPLSEKESKAQ